MREDGLFPDLPFTEVTMQGQNKNEDIFEVLGVGSEKPYFLHFTFYICLAIIKKNNFDATKDEKQKEHFIKYLRYIKQHYKDLVKEALLWSPICDFPGCDIPHLRSKKPIPTSFGLKENHLSALTQERTITLNMRHMFNNSMNDFNFYFERAKGMKEALLEYL